MRMCTLCKSTCRAWSAGRVLCRREGANLVEHEMQIEHAKQSEHNVTCIPY